MRKAILKLYVKGQILWNTLKEDEGQDLVEYAAVIMIVVLGATAGLHTLAGGINNVMSNVVNQMSNDIG